MPDSGSRNGQERGGGTEVTPSYSLRRPMVGAGELGLRGPVRRVATAAPPPPMPRGWRRPLAPEWGQNVGCGGANRRTGVVTRASVCECAAAVLWTPRGHVPAHLGLGQWVAPRSNEGHGVEHQSDENVGQRGAGRGNGSAVCFYLDIRKRYEIFFNRLESFCRFMLFLRPPCLHPPPGTGVNVSIHW